MSTPNVSPIVASYRPYHDQGAEIIPRSLTALGASSQRESSDRPKKSGARQTKLSA
jgi:hypothetical protein